MTWRSRWPRNGAEKVDRQLLESCQARKRGVDMERVMSGKVESVLDVDKDFVSVFNGYDGVLEPRSSIRLLQTCSRTTTGT